MLNDLIIMSHKDNTICVKKLIFELTILKNTNVIQTRFYREDNRARVYCS